MSRILSALFCLLLLPSLASAQECFPGPCPSGVTIGGPACGGGICEDLPNVIGTRRTYYVWFNEFIEHDDFRTGVSGNTDVPWHRFDIGSPLNTSQTFLNNSHSGGVRVSPGDKDSSSTNFMLNGSDDVLDRHVGEIIRAADGRIIAWEARLKGDDVSAGSMWVGLIGYDATPIDGTPDFTIADGLTCISRLGDVTCYGIRGSSSKASTVTITMVDDTWMTLGMRCVVVDISENNDSGSCDLYVDGVNVETLTDATNGVIPNATGMEPAWGAHEDAVAGEIIMTVNYFWTAATRE